MAYDYKNKAGNIRLLNKYMLAKTVSMFEYSGLPETLPASELEKLIQKNGFAFVTKANDGNIYAFAGSIGGECDAYGNGKNFIIANPHLNFNKTCDIEKDGVLFQNDDLRLGLMPIFERGNTFLVENDINMMLWGYNSRTQKLISASDDRTKESADQYVKKIIDGDISVVSENAMFEGVKVQGSQNSAGASVQQMIEFTQYLKATMLNEVGISSNFNMKRERLISSELDAAEDSLFPLVYNMMQQRIAAVEKLNKMFGLSVTVDFGSIWALKNKELVDGDTTNNQPNSSANNADNGEPQQQASGAEQERSGEQETTQQQQEEVNHEQRTEEQSVDVDNQRSDNGDNQSRETEVDPERERERGQGQSPDSGTDTDTDELQAIIDDPEASEEDKQAARELIQEQEK
jgi:hypothetical protein